MLNTLIDFGTLNLLVHLLGAVSGFSLIFSNAAAFGIANLNSYAWNRKWTFGEKGQGTISQYLFFLTLSLGGLAVNTMVLYTFSRLLSGTFPADASGHPVMVINVAKAFATAAGMTWNFLVYRFIVFRKEPFGQNPNYRPAFWR